MKHLILGRWCKSYKAAGWSNQADKTGAETRPSVSRNLIKNQSIGESTAEQASQLRNHGKNPEKNSVGGAHERNGRSAQFTGGNENAKGHI